jgi:hypothetical protein
MNKNTESSVNAWIRYFYSNEVWVYALDCMSFGLVCGSFINVCSFSLARTPYFVFLGAREASFVVLLAQSKRTKRKGTLLARRPTKHSIAVRIPNSPSGSNRDALCRYLHASGGNDVIVAFCARLWDI